MTFLRIAPAAAAVYFALTSPFAAAQQSQPSRAAGIELTARVDPPAAANAAAAAPATSANTPGAVPAANSATDPSAVISNAELMKNMMEMKAEIADLKAQIKARDAADTVSADAIKAYERDVASLKAAVSPATTVTVTASTPVTQDAAPPAAQAPAPAPVDHVTPFADFYWGWLNGNPRTIDCPLCTKYFTPEIRVDTNYNLDFNHPKDDTINGSSEVFRSQEVQLEQLGIGGDLLIDHVHARLMTQFGEYSVTTPRNDGSVSRGQWNLDDAYRYLAEAYGGYHWDKMHGINLDGGIFMSYIGLFSYYNFDNWAYQPSFVSSNTPWFFNGIRGQFFLTQHLKIEPWFINGWQSYARYGGKPGLGGQIKYTPTGKINIISNNYGMGEDDWGIEGRTRFHTDNSLEYKYYDSPTNTLNRMAFSITADAGCEEGSGVACMGTASHKVWEPATSTTPAVLYAKQSFLGWMAYNRWWFNKDRYAITAGGGYVNNPGRYLVLLPPINGATAVTGSAYFPEDPGQPYHGEDGTITYDFMPRQFITYRVEYGYRHSDVPYWAGRRGSTPPGGVTNAPIGSPDDFTCTNGSSSFDSGMGYTPMPWLSYSKEYAANVAAANAVCASPAPGSPLAVASFGAGPLTLWQPDMRRDQQMVIFAILVKW